MSDGGPDLTMWQQLGALAGTALAAIGVGRATKGERIVEAIQKMERTLDTRFAEMHSDIKLLLDRGERR